MAGLVTTPARDRVVGARVLRPRRTRLAPAATPAAPAIAEPAK
jgi:hypothetical protein